MPTVPLSWTRDDRGPVSPLGAFSSGQTRSEDPGSVAHGVTSLSGASRVRISSAASPMAGIFAYPPAKVYFSDYMIVASAGRDILR